MRKLIGILGLFLLVGVAFGVYSYNKGPRQLNNEKTEITIKASSLLEAFEQDETKANDIYLDKIIEVSGTVLEISNTETTNIILDTGNPMSTIICELEEKITDIQPYTGKEVVVKGQCTGYLMDVVLVKSIIVKNN